MIEIQKFVVVEAAKKADLFLAPYVGYEVFLISNERFIMDGEVHDWIEEYAAFLTKIW